MQVKKYVSLSKEPLLMKKRVLTLLILTTIWGLGSWWYYTCKIKGFCDTSNKILSENTTTSSPKTANDTEAGSKQVVDSDGDGLSDEEEITLSTDPNKIDTDGDGIPDNEEVGSEPNAAIDTDADGKINALDDDDDNDNLPTLLETNIKTNPLEKDSDGDGIDDATEVGSNPSVPINTDGDKLIDALDTDDDNDGLATIDEIAIGTNHLKADSDGDGINDAEEVGEATSKPKDADKDGIIDVLDNNNSPKAEVVEEENKPDVPPEQIKDETTTEEQATADKSTSEEKAKEQQASEPPASQDKAAPDEMTIEPINGGSDNAIHGSLLYFPFNSAAPKLSKSASAYFTKIANWLKESADNSVILTGHTDSIGAEATNHKLGLQRASIIRKMLIKLGAPKAQVKANSKGETQPLKNNKTKLGRKKNRRVELTPLGKGAV